MAGPGSVLPNWNGTVDGQQVSAGVLVPSFAYRPYFVWLVNGQEVPHQRLARHVAGTPARVLTYVQETPGMPDTASVGWVDLPDAQQLDAAGELVRSWVDALTVAELLAIGREMAERDVDWWRVKVADAKQSLNEAEEWMTVARLMAAALDFDDATQRDVAVRLVADWQGSVDDFVQAVVDITA